MEFGVDFNEPCFKMELPAYQRHQYLLTAHILAWNEDGRISISAGDLPCLRSSDVSAIKASDTYGRYEMHGGGSKVLFLFPFFERETSRQRENVIDLR
jgi:hypothetical protein